MVLDTIRGQFLGCEGVGFLFDGYSEQCKWTNC
jgi:hypothetical protein